MFEKIIFSSIMTALIFMTTQSAFAEIKRVEMRVDGMTCPFCVYGIEKKLKKVDGIKEPSSNLKTGIVIMKVKKGKSIYIDRLHEAVKESGFTPGDVKITAIGKLTRHNEHPALKVSGSEQIFLLITGNKDEAISELDGKILKEIEAAVENSSKEISITGFVTSSSPNDPQYLNVDTFESASESRP